MAYSRLLVLCKDQVIAASATIKNEIDMCIFIANKMNENRVENYVKYDNIVIIKYENRVVPLKEYRFTNNKIIQFIRNENGEENIENINNEIYNYSPSSENTFILLLEMKKNDMLPAIFFEDSDDVVWKTYLDLIKYLESKESNDYFDYHNFVDIINNHIDKFNIDFHTKIGDISEKDNMDSTRTRFSRTEDIKKSMKIARMKSINTIIIESKILLERSIFNCNSENYTYSSEFFVLEKNDSNKYLNDLYEISDSYKKIKNIKISHAHIEMLKILQNFMEYTPDQLEPIYPIDINKGSYYRFSNSSCGIEQLKAMREPGDNENNWKQRKKMEALAKAQNIKPKDIDGIIDIIMRGLEFGISIIISSLPFVLQNIILENIRTKNMGIVFASEDMSMGINYPLRSVNIRSPNKLNIAKLIQMSGRCGRRGKDNQAHVIYWGIKNANEAHHAFIKPLVYNRDFIIEDINLRNGLMIKNHNDIALELGIIHYIKYFKENIKQQEPIKKFKEQKKTLNFKKKYINYKNTKKIESDNLDDYEKIMFNNKQDEVKLYKSQFLDPTLRCLCNQMDLDADETNELTKMICDIDNDIMKESYSINAFKKSRKVKSIMSMMIELYNYYSSCSHPEFLDFIEAIVNILKICEYRLIKLSN